MQVRVEWTVNFCLVDYAKDPRLALQKIAWSACSPACGERNLGVLLDCRLSVDGILGFVSGLKFIITKGNICGVTNTTNRRMWLVNRCGS
jgi:hypothetical protein